MENRPPVDVKVKHDKFIYLTEKSSFSFPDFTIPRSLHNEGNYIISLGSLTRWLGE